jgi:hypothetical protein
MWKVLWWFCELQKGVPISGDSLSYNQRFNPLPSSHNWWSGQNATRPTPMNRSGVSIALVACDSQTRLQPSYPQIQGMTWNEIEGTYDLSYSRRDTILQERRPSGPSHTSRWRCTVSLPHHSDSFVPFQTVFRCLSLSGRHIDRITHNGNGTDCFPAGITFGNLNSNIVG